MAMKRFSARFNFLMKPEEVEMLSALADRDGLTPSDVLRQLIRRQHAAVFGEQPAKPKPKGRRAKR